VSLKRTYGDNWIWFQRQGALLVAEQQCQNTEKNKTGQNSHIKSSKGNILQ